MLFHKNTECSKFTFAFKLIYQKMQFLPEASDFKLAILSLSSLCDIFSYKLIACFLLFWVLMYMLKQVGFVVHLMFYHCQQNINCYRKYFCYLIILLSFQKILCCLILVFLMLHFLKKILPMILHLPVEVTVFISVTDDWVQGAIQGSF